MADERPSASKATAEVLVAVVLVVAAAAIVLGVMSALEGALWWLFKVAIFVLVVYVIVRLVVARRR